jgi:hypothetical protein
MQRSERAGRAEHAYERYGVGDVLRVIGSNWVGGSADAEDRIFVIDTGDSSITFIFPNQAGRVSEKANVQWLRQLYDSSLEEMDGISHERATRELEENVYETKEPPNHARTKSTDKHDFRNCA